MFEEKGLIYRFVRFEGLSPPQVHSQFLPMATTEQYLFEEVYIVTILVRVYTVYGSRKYFKAISYLKYSG